MIQLTGAIQFGLWCPEAHNKILDFGAAGKIKSLRKRGLHVDIVPSLCEKNAATPK